MTSTIVHKACHTLLRWSPVLGSLVMCIHCLTLIQGVSTQCVEFIYDTSVITTILMIVASYALQFCIWHRLCIVYTYLVGVCIDYERNFGFGSALTPMRWIMFILGIVLIVMFIAKRCYDVVHAD